MKYSTIFLALLSSTASAQDARGNIMLRGIAGNILPSLRNGLAAPAGCAADSDCTEGDNGKCDFSDQSSCGAKGNRGCCKYTANDVPPPAPVDPAPAPSGSCEGSDFGMCCMSDDVCGGGGCSCDFSAADMCGGTGAHGCCVFFESSDEGKAALM